MKLYYAPFLTLFFLTPAFGASTDTPKTIESHEISTTKEVPEKVVSFKAQDTVREIKPKEKITRLRYNVQEPPQEPLPQQKKASAEKPKKKEAKRPRDIPLTSMQVQENTAEPVHPQFLDKQKIDIKP